MKFHPVNFRVTLANHDVTIRTFHHISRTMERVHPVIGDGDVLFAATKNSGHIVLLKKCPVHVHTFLKIVATDR